METVPGQQAVAEGALRLQELQKNQAPVAANFQHLRIDFQALDFHDGETAGNNLVEVGRILAAAAAVDGKDGMQRRLRPLRRSKQIKNKKEKIELFWQ